MIKINFLISFSFLLNFFECVGARILFYYYSIKGTTAVLMAFDSFEVRKIVQLGDSVLEQLSATKVRNLRGRNQVLILTSYYFVFILLGHCEPGAARRSYSSMEKRKPPVPAWPDTLTLPLSFLCQQSMSESLILLAELVEARSVWPFFPPTFLLTPSSPLFSFSSLLLSFLFLWGAGCGLWGQDNGWWWRWLLSAFTRSRPLS